jgi:hypothetical protein
MLIRFSSIATESITMFGDTGMLLIKMLGASNSLPGAIGGDDISTAIGHLKRRLDECAAKTAQSLHSQVDEAHPEYEPPIALASRAGPLIQILERAAAAKAPVMWEMA